MKYFAKETIVNSFNSLKDSVDNKLLGILAILKVLDSDSVIDNKTYCVIDGKLSRVLDDMCYLESCDKYGDAMLYVKFSKQWKVYVEENFIKNGVNVFSLLAFLYKFECFDEEPSHENLLSRFCEEYHLAQDTVKEWFSLDKISLEFSEKPLTRKELQEALNISTPTISFSPPYSVMARAGEISRAPFIQTLYAGMDSIKCLLILKDDIDLYYSSLTHSKSTLPSNSQDIPSKYKPFVAAIKTKPFLLLAGISGTGKSKIVRDMAKACWGKDDPNRTAQEPDNFMMIQVRPNWHDSTELIGYVSNIPEPHYVVGPFLRAIVKAWELTAEYSEDGKTMPYFVCLDEMNLAPVEQYFAEYLSVIESRTGSGRDITTDVMLKEAEPWYLDLCNKLAKKSPLALREKLVKEGISLPPNLIVCGTVNMDETTYAFSRKVLDRAMTIEMNEVVLKAGLGEAKESFPQIDPESLLAGRISPEAYYEAEEHKDTIDEVLGWLGKINEKLEGTPFKIAYRTRNEILLYVIHSEKLGVDRKDAFDEAVNMKILPRIEGDQKKVDTVLTELRQVLKEDVDIADENSSPSLKKLTMMENRLKKQYYCTYWN